MIAIQCTNLCAQYKISGTVTCEDNDAEEVIVYLENTKHRTLTDTLKNYKLLDIPKGEYVLVAYNELHKLFVKKIIIKADTSIYIKLTPEKEIVDLGLVQLNSRKADFFGISKLPDFDGTAIYEGKKTEVVTLKNVTANVATNNARQVFSKVCGLNIWESDAAGLQLGIGARGLSPNRTANFNVRQNGYDISADALGYPESYYTPPLEAIKEIQFVRGAASLQYGTQLGGMVNFVFNEGPKDKKIQYQGRLSGGSYNFLNTFNSLGGTVGKTNYYTAYQYKQGDAFRKNSHYYAHFGYLAVSRQINSKIKLTVNYTHENYLAQQPGGLTDYDFKTDYTISKRKRNWFAVNWNLPSINFDYNVNKNTVINWRAFALFANRKSLGVLTPISQVDLGQDRTYIYDRFANIGTELRVLKHYKFNKKHKNTFVLGYRAYKGFDSRKQGSGNNLSGADFYFLNPNSLEKFDYDLHSKNYALFGENIFKLSPRLSITPGARLEFINTSVLGYVRDIQKNILGDVIYDKKIFSNKKFNRSVFLYGIGTSYYITKDIETYINYTRNFRAATFSDMIVSNPSLIVDSLLKDERGFNADWGVRGFVGEFMHFDAGVYMLYYNNRIGETFLSSGQRYRTNIGTSITKGIECMAEVDLLRIFTGKKYKTSFSYFVNTALNNSTYIKGTSQEYTVMFKNKKVELVPNVTLRTGFSIKKGNFSSSIQYSYISKQYTDALNTEKSAGAIVGLIPSYYVLDYSIKYQFKRYYLSGTVNNLTNNKYFTRRAESYPGPGIIPSDPIQFYITVGLTL